MLNPNLYGSPKQKKAYETVALENRELLSEISLTDRFILERRYTDIGGSYLDDFQYLTSLQTIVDLIQQFGQFTPRGPAGGELEGTYPNPTLNNDAVINKILTGYTLGNLDPISETDTILEAFGKLEAQIQNSQPKLTTDLTVTGIGTFGAVADGKTWVAGTLIENVLTELVRKRVSPDYVAPTLGLTLTGGTILETGTNETLLLSALFTQNDAGALTLLSIEKNAVEVINTNVSNSLSYNDILTIPEGVVTYQSSATYSIGPIKNDTFGDPDPTGRILAGSIDSVTRTLTGIYPYFWGVSDTQPSVVSIQALLTGNDLSVNKVVASAAGNITINYNTTATTKFHWFAIPAVGGIVGTDRVSWYFSETNKGDFLGGSGKLWTAKNTANLNSPTGLWTAKSYKIYFTQYLTSFEAPIQLRVL